MRFFVRVVVGAVVLVAALMSQEEQTIALGESDKPPSAFAEVSIALKDGKGTFAIATGKARGISFHVETGTARITCDRKEMAADKWYRTDGPLSCTVKVATSTSIDLNVLEKSATTVMQLAPKDTPGVVQIKVSDAMAKGAAPILLVFEAPQATNHKPDTTQTSNNQSTNSAPPTPKDEILPIITLAIALVALLIAGMSLFRKPKVAPEKTRVDDRSAAVADDRFRKFSEDLTTLQTRLQSAESQQQASSSDISTRASQQDVAALKQMLDQRMKGLQDALTGLQSSQNATFKHLSADITAVQNELQRHSQVLDQLSGRASENLVTLLKALPRDYLGSAAGQDTAKLLDLAVSDFFAQSVPPRDGLKPNKERTQALDRAIGNLHDQIAPQFPDSTQRLKPLIDQARQIQSEIDDLERVAGTNRMQLRFEVEFYASKANREGLMSGIATGLKNQIQKVEKPIEYFDRRCRALAAAAAQTTSDFLDANVDVKRTDARIQELLLDVLNAAAIEQIAPAPNDEFRASEHAVVQVMPRAGGAGGTPLVARLVSRGFRQGSQIVRKASVILYE